MRQTHHIEQFMKTMRMVHRLLPKNIFDTESDVTPLQLEVLMYLHMHPKSTVSALGEYLELSSSATTQLTDRLAKLRFIKRENNQEDRRSILLSLTARGNKIFSQLHKLHMEKMKDFFALMPEKDAKELTRIFKNIHQKVRGQKNA